MSKCISQCWDGAAGAFTQCRLSQNHDEPRHSDGCMEWLDGHVVSLGTDEDGPEYARGWNAALEAAALLSETCRVCSDLIVSDRLPFCEEKTDYDHTDSDYAEYDCLADAIRALKVPVTK